MEVGIDRLALDLALDVRVDMAAGGLEIDLERPQDLAGEAAGALLERELIRAQRQVHADRMAHSGTALPSMSQAAGRVERKRTGR